MKLLNNQQMKDLDRQAIEKYKIPGIILMENAGIRVVEEIYKVLPQNHNKVVIICGVGNNGGDGFVVARHLINKGIDVEVYILGKANQIKGDAKINFDIVKAMELKLHFIEDQVNIDRLKNDLYKANIIVDALLGTGIDRPVEGLLKDIIENINYFKGKTKILSIDIPSGVNGDDGSILGCCVDADITVTFQLPKIGNINMPGGEYSGDLIIKDIGIPLEVIKESPYTGKLITEELVKGLLPPRKIQAHKGSYGSALIIAGGKESWGSVAISSFGGAAMLASKAALRCGVGLLKVAIPGTLIPAMNLQVMEAIALPQRLDIIEEELSIVDVIAIGSGCGQSQDFEKLLEEVILKTSKPMVLDADALNIISKNKDLLRDLNQPAVITPHPGEMARLTGLTPEVVNANRINIAKNFAEEYNVTVVLKGAGTVISSPERDVYLNTTGNPGMATAGTGDVLTGMIASFIAQGIDPLMAAVTAVYLHGKSGDNMTDKLGEYSLMAGDIIDGIRI